MTSASPNRAENPSDHALAVNRLRNVADRGPAPSEAKGHVNQVAQEPFALGGGGNGRFTSREDHGISGDEGYGAVYLTGGGHITVLRCEDGARGGC